MKIKDYSKTDFHTVVIDVDKDSDITISGKRVNGHLELGIVVDESEDLSPLDLFNEEEIRNAIDVADDYIKNLG